MTRKEEYALYLKSPIWRRLRIKAQLRAGHRCQVCNSPKKLDVHHRKYPERFGTESVDDLTVLCSNCHKKFHSTSKLKKERIYADKSEKQIAHKKRRHERRKTKKKLSTARREELRQQENKTIVMLNQRFGF